MVSLTGFAVEGYTHGMCVLATMIGLSALMVGLHRRRKEAVQE